MELVPDGIIKKSHTEIVAGKEIRVIDEFELYCISLVPDSPWCRIKKDNAKLDDLES